MNERFLAWPGWRHVAYTALLSALIDVLFVAVYFGADFVTGRRVSHLHLFLPQELAIPLWPSMIVVYDSLYLVLLIAPFVIRTRQRVNELALGISTAIVVAGAVFLLVPAELGFAPSVVSGPLKQLFEASDRLNLDYNLVPSLHVALAVICLGHYQAGKSRLVRIALAMWGCALVLSTLLTHQHHVLDAVTGAALAWGVLRLTDSVPLLFARRQMHAE
ncbi:MAG TPA: phosphatase PAP2 family protein [Thermoanaerobaculia bacterium]|nr:phosphatase PAP2 family protein [Thermoanaerobaculia bacterium]